MRVTIVAALSLITSAAFAQMNNPPPANPPPPDNPGASDQMKQPGSQVNPPGAQVNPPGAQAEQQPAVETTKLSHDDQQFVNKAAQANQAEIKLGELGVQKGSTAEVRDLGQKMIDDHAKVGDQLQTISTRENFPLPAEPNAQQRATYERLSKLKGSEFDRAYLDQLKTDHEKAISLFQKESQSGTDPQLKQFAETTLPSLKHHEQSVKRTSHKM